MPSLPGTFVRALNASLAALLAFAVAVTVEPAPAAAAGDGAEAPTERLDGWLAANRSFRARFSQSVFDEEGVEISVSGGTVAFRRPYRFRWDYDAPTPQIIVSDGRELWWYDIELAQVTVRPADTALDGTPAALLAGPGRAGEHFRVAALDSVLGVDWFQLVPRGADAAFRALRIGLEGDEVRALEMDDGFGQTTRIDFFDVEHNPRLADALFRFVPPPDADVVRGE